jgi:hypothetical protein
MKKRMFKGAIEAVVRGVLILSLAACGGNNNQVEKSDTGAENNN